MAGLDDLDLGALYRAHMARTTRGEKPPAAWDARAEGMRAAVEGSAYAEAFLARMDLSGCRTLLDVGCGPGTLALPLAPRLEHVHGLDHSPGMLAALAAGARERGLANVSGVLRAWEEPWDGVPVCDVVVASRSMHVADMADALAKLQAHARRRVYLTHRAGGRRLDGAVLAALGRTVEPPPDWLYVIALLHRMGVAPRLDFLESPGKLAGCAGADEFARRMEWSVGPLGEGERAALRALWDREGPRLAGEPIRWAFVGWDVTRGA